MPSPMKLSLLPRIFFIPSRMAGFSIAPNQLARRLALGLVVLIAGSAQAEVSTWTGDAAASGSTVGDWYTTSPGNWSGDVAPSFTNTNDIQIAGTQDLDQYIRQAVTIRSLEFTSSNVGATQIGLKAGNGNDRDLTFSADLGNSTLTVDAAASGDKTLGTSGGMVTPGEVVITSDLDVIHNGSGSLIFAAEIRGAGNITLTGASTTEFHGLNSYQGDTTIEGASILVAGTSQAFGTLGMVTLAASDSTLELADGVNIGNALTVTDDGDHKTLRLASAAASGSWSGEIAIAETNATHFEVMTASGQTLTLSGVISGSGAAGITKTGAGTVTLSGTNIYSGNTTVDDGSLTLSNDAQLAFTVGTIGVNTTLSGSGTVTFNGSFLFDLANASTTLDDSWQIIDVSSLDEAFGPAFKLSSTDGDFIEISDGVWVIDENGIGYEFSEHTGLMTVTPEARVTIDLASASTTLDDSWLAIDVSGLNDAFRLSSTNGDFIEISDGVWAIAENGIGYEFSEHTGLMTVKPVAHWMSGGLGVAWKFRPHDPAEVVGWVMDDTVAGVNSIPNVRWININLTDGAGGAQFLATHSVLSQLDTDLGVNVFIPNQRDLFIEAVTRFRAEGYKIMVYYATQGPALLKHGIESFPDAVEDANGNFSSTSYDAWLAHVASVYGDSSRESLEKAHAEIVFAEYAERYGDLIDAWWFDQTFHSNNQLHYDIAKQFNPNVAVGMSSSINVLNDFTKGHVLGVDATDVENLEHSIHPAELSEEGYDYTPEGHPNLRQYWSPLGDTYNGGDIVWTVDQGADWGQRMRDAGGAWTWSLDLIDREFGSIRTDMLDMAIAAQAKIEENNSNIAPIFSQPSYYGGGAQIGVAYTSSFSGAATDVDGDTLTYELAYGGPDWLTIAPNGTLSGTPYDTWNLGMNRFTLIASDGKGLVGFAELEIYVRDGSGSDIAYSNVSFNNLRPNLTSGEINGLAISDPKVTITTATDGNDAILSLSITDQDLDGVGGDNDTLSWDVRVKGYTGGSYTLNGNDSSATLGTSTLVGTTDNEFGVSEADLRFVNAGESLQYSVENVVLTTDITATVQFDGFDEIWGTTGTYILGTGASGLESITLAANGELPLSAAEILTFTSTSLERLRDPGGDFTIYPNNAPYFLASFIEVIHGEGVAYSETLTNLAATATDPDGDSLTYSKADGPTWLSVAPDGTLSGSPGAADVGLNSFTLQVTDPWNATDTLIFEVTVDNKDTDGDCYPDWQEAIMGTDPADASSKMTVSEQPTNTGFDLSWSTVSGRTYKVELSVDLMVWETYLENIAHVPGEDVLVDVTVDASSSERVFYRIGVQN